MSKSSTLSINRANPFQITALIHIDDLSQLHVTYTPVRATKGLVHNMQPNRLKQGSIHHATDQSRCKNMW